jgi:hypothetical protein
MAMLPCAEPLLERKQTSRSSFSLLAGLRATPILAWLFSCTAVFLYTQEVGSVVI